MQAIAHEALHGLSGRLVWLCLLHSLWLGLVTAALTALVLQTCTRYSHQSRYAILLTALIVVALGVPTVTSVEYLATPRRSGHALSGTVVAAFVPRGTSGVPSPAASPALAAWRSNERSSAAVWLGPLRGPLSRAALVARAIQPFVLAFWSLAVFGLGAVLALGFKGLVRLGRDASPAPLTVRVRAQRLGRLLRLRRVPTVRVHPTIGEPCLYGVFHPVILLPGRWLATARADLLDAVLAHELAHARRRDHLANLAQRVLETLLFFHPGVHWLSRTLRLQRELCADALAARLTADPLALARALESVARLRLARPLPSPLGAAITLGGGRESLLPRIQELIGMTPIRPRTRVWPYIVLPSAVAFGCLAASLGLAEDGPAPKQRVHPPEGAASAPPMLAPAPVPQAAGTGSLICYEVRFLDNVPFFRWEQLKGHGHVKVVTLDHDVSGWIISGNVDAVLRKHKKSDDAGTQLSAPKVTTSENARAVILLDPAHPGAPLSNAGPGRKWGSQVDVQGSFTPQGVRISFDLNCHTVHPADDVTTRIACKGYCDIPDGFSLVVRVWLVEFPDRPTCERLVVITPRRVVVKPEEQAPAPNTKPATSQPAPR